MTQATEKKSLVKSGLLLSLMTLLSRLLGLLREMTKAAFLGTSAYADAFGIAFMIPNLFRRLFAENSISAAFIPTFRRYLEDDKDAKSHESIQLFVSSTLTLVSFLTAIITLLGILSAPLIVPIFYGRGAEDGIIAETVFLTRLMFPYLFVISAAAFLQGILNGCNIFAPSGFTPVLFNVTVVAATHFLSPILPNHGNLPQDAAAARAMAAGVLAGGCLQAIFQWPFVRKTAWKATLTGLRNAFTNPGTRKVVALIVPTIIGMAAYQLNDLVSTAIAGKTGTGTVSSLQYSLRLQELILGIFAVSIGTVILPDLSGLAKRQKWLEFNDMLLNAVRIIALITIPVTFYSLVSGRELISLVYKSRQFDEESVALTLNVFRLHIAGLFFIAVNRVISPAFYAQGNTRLPTLAGIISFGANIVLAAVLALPLKGSGIALALTLASLVNTACLLLFMRKMPSMDLRKITKKILGCAAKTAFFSITASAPAFFVRRILVDAAAGRGRLFAYGIPALGTAAVFAATGVAMLAIFRDEAAASLFAKVKGKFLRKKK